MKLEDIIIAATLGLGHELDKPKTDSRRLIFASEDEKIVLTENGQSKTIATGGPALTETTASNGYIELPMSNASGKLILQYGVATLPANTSQIFDFPKIFPTKCLAIIASHKLNDAVSSIMIDHENKKDTFKVSIQGGNANESIQWIALGY